MIKISNLIIILCLTLSSIFGQTQNLILTREQSNKWMDSLKVLSPERQLLAIKERLLTDTNVFIRQSYPDGIKVTDSLGCRVYGDGKPMLIIGGYAMIIDNKTQTTKILGLTKLLNETYIKKIFVLSPNDPSVTAIYGNSGQYGIIIMTLISKKNIKLFKRLKLK